MAPSLSRGAKRAMYLMLCPYISLGNLYMAIHSLHYHRTPRPYLFFSNWRCVCRKPVCSNAFNEHLLASELWARQWSRILKKETILSVFQQFEIWSGRLNVHTRYPTKNNNLRTYKYMQNNIVHIQWYQTAHSNKAKGKDHEHWYRKTNGVAFVPTSWCKGNVKLHPEAIFRRILAMLYLMLLGCRKWANYGMCREIPCLKI